MDKANSPVHFSQMDCALSWSAGLQWTLWTTETSWRAKSAGCGKGSASVWDDLLQAVITERKGISNDQYITIFFFFIVYSFHLFPKFGLFTPSPSVLAIFTISWGKFSFNTFLSKKSWCQNFYFCMNMYPITKCSGGGIFTLLLHLSTFTLKCFFCFLAHYTPKHYIRLFTPLHFIKKIFSYFEL